MPHNLFFFSAEKAGYTREVVLSMKDGENKMPLHTAVQSGDVHVSTDGRGSGTWLVPLFISETFRS